MHTQQHVGQVLLGVDVVRHARGHQRIEAGEVLPCSRVPDKRKVLWPKATVPCEHIIRVLSLTRGPDYGPSGAAAEASARVRKRP